MYIEIDNNKYEVDIIKKNNKNTYIRVKDGKIIVTTNYFSSNKGIIKLINDNIVIRLKQVQTYCLNLLLKSCLFIANISAVLVDCII